MILSRSKWTGLAKVGAELQGPQPIVAIHHSSSPHVEADAGQQAEVRAMLSMDRHHRDVNGWKGIGYNWCVFQSGNVFEGRGWLRRGAHEETVNSKSHGICFVIDGEHHAPTAAAIRAVQELITEGVRVKAIVPDYDLGPHDRWEVGRICPGKMVKAILPELRAQNVPAKPLRRALLRAGDQGPDVQALQERLRVEPASGFYGRLTIQAVKQFQEKHGLVADGIVGPQTFAKLKM